MRPIVKGSTDQSVVIRIVDSTDGTPETGVVYNTSGIDLWYRRELEAKTSITEATLAALTTAHADGGFLHIGDGYYRLDLPDAAVATGANGCMVGGTVTGMVVIGCYIPLCDVSPYDAVRGGMTALPNANAGANGGLPLGNASGAVTLASATHTGAVIPTVTTLTGHTAQTGDSFARLGAPVGASISADIAAAKANLVSLLALVDTEVQLILDRIGAFTGTGVNTILGFFKAVMKKDASNPSDLGGTYDAATDSLEFASEDAAALRDFGIMQVTTIATLASQTSFTLTAGSADNSAYLGAKVMVTDATTEEQKAVGVISAYTGSTKTITLQEDPAIFTMAVGDHVTILTPAVDVFKRQVDGTTTFEQGQRLQNSAAAGKVSGAATTTVVIRDLADSKDRITATVDADGNRSAVTRVVT